MARGTVRRTLQRSSAVSAGALLVALAGGGLSLAGAVPGSDSGGGLVSTVGSATSGNGVTVPGTSTTLPTPTLPDPVAQALPLPTGTQSPAPTPTTKSGPIQQVVKTVDKTVHKTVHTTVSTVKALGNGSGTSGSGGGTTTTPNPPTAGRPTGSGSTTKTLHAGGTTVAAPLGGRLGHTVPAATSGARTVDALGSDAAGSVAPAQTNLQAAGQRAAALGRPQLAPTPSLSIPPVVGLGSHTLPGAIVAVAFAALAALVASHIGVWQNRVRRSVG
jgi:hypothetical protein